MARLGSLSEQQGAVCTRVSISMITNWTPYCQEDLFCGACQPTHRSDASSCRIR